MVGNGFMKIINYNIPHVSPIMYKNNATFTSKANISALPKIEKPIGALLCLAVLPNVNKNNSVKEDVPNSKTIISPLGESLLNPSFPEEFCDNKDFIEWALAMGLQFELKGNSAEFTDKSGNLVRRITKKNAKSNKVLVDRILIYENGKETAKFLKKVNEPIKYYYDRTPEGGYMTMAELHSDERWYDREGNILQFNPLTNEPQDGYIKTKPSLGESLINPSFPTYFDVQAFEEWAKTLNMPTPVIEDGIAKFYDYNDRLVRQITENKNQKGKVYNDYVFIYDNNGILVGKYVKYYISNYPLYNYGRDEDGNFKYTAQLREDGLWHPFGQRWDEILPNNPVTGEPQIQKD